MLNNCCSFWAGFSLCPQAPQALEKIECEFMTYLNARMCTLEINSNNLIDN